MAAQPLGELRPSRCRRVRVSTATPSQGRDQESDGYAVGVGTEGYDWIKKAAPQANSRLSEGTRPFFWDVSRVEIGPLCAKADTTFCLLRQLFVEARTLWGGPISSHVVASQQCEETAVSCNSRGPRYRNK